MLDTVQGHDNTFSALRIMSVCLERELDDFEGARDGAMQNYKVVREEGRWSLMFQSRKRNQGSKTGEVLR